MSEKTEAGSDAVAGQVERPVRPSLPEREAARVYAELREIGYTWHQAHETMQRIAAERERCAIAGGAAADAGMDGAGVADAIRKAERSSAGAARLGPSLGTRG